MPSETKEKMSFQIRTPPDRVAFLPIAKQASVRYNDNAFS
ncbi:hypothetical protein GTCCBUS3UF5_25870 [Geobacillus thermoleovorans CCB_US3_UF5]|uniref:Uncharacterized protein n=1 Tax=Geobacillus thermoleovorans CCB_US3_UF5 TaxID=1111068 RepID=A0ABN3ZWZ9_GEOTH|nr:hypothetical protein GTCCBUS3UF5_25870 [Geobacillus thermoleovorans CCB_US3_UF5]GAJ58354.1 hypothetical protein B23_1560 [Geobacillus thermoleovorans B23]